MTETEQAYWSMLQLKAGPASNEIAQRANALYEELGQLLLDHATGKDREIAMGSLAVCKLSVFKAISKSFEDTHQPLQVVRGE